MDLQVVYSAKLWITVIPVPGEPENTLKIHRSDYLKEKLMCEGLSPAEYLLCISKTKNVF